MMEVINQFTGYYSFLSNFYPCKVEYEGDIYPSVEHAYQAAKTFDKSERQKIRNAKTPGLAKKLGRHVSLRPDWEDIKVTVMLQLLRSKFSQPELKQKLLDTGDAYLQEGNYWYDAFWGVDLRTGTGKNVLGRLLMKIRDELRKDNKPVSYFL